MSPQGLRSSRSRRSIRSFRYRPVLEWLEDRWVPSAIRLLSGFNTNTLAANDDGSTGLVNIGFTVNFFGLSRNQLYVNNNGNVTFNGPLSTFTPFGLTTSIGTPIIAPFFADVDTRGSGSGLVHYGNATVDGRNAFGVNWFNQNLTTGQLTGVGYFGAHTDRLNTFQLVLIDRSDTGAGNFDIEFNYNQVRWETGDASGGSGGLGGSPARVGFSNGTGVAGSFFEFFGSGVSGAFLDANLNTGLINNTLNSDTPGRYRFEVRSGGVTATAITSISPTAAAVGGPGFTLTVNGINFVNGVSTVRWNGTPLATTFVSANRLDAVVPASLLAAAGPANINVAGPTGGVSNTVVFTINNPVPALANLSQTSAPAGSAGFTVTATGSNLNATSLIRVNGLNRAALFNPNNPTQLLFNLTSDDLAIPGPIFISVFNPGPGGGTSATQVFTVQPTEGSGTAPTISAFTPTSASSTGGSVTLTVFGSNFRAGSVIRINGVNRPTTFNSSLPNQLTTTLTSTDLSTPNTLGTFQIQVLNPGTTPEQSNPVFFTVLGGSIQSVQTTTVSSNAQGASQAHTLFIPGRISLQFQGPGPGGSVPITVADYGTLNPIPGSTVVGFSFVDIQAPNLGPEDQLIVTFPYRIRAALVPAQGLALAFFDPVTHARRLVSGSTLAANSFLRNQHLEGDTLVGEFILVFDRTSLPSTLGGFVATSRTPSGPGGFGGTVFTITVADPVPAATPTPVAVPPPLVLANPAPTPNFVADTTALDQARATRVLISAGPSLTVITGQDNNGTSSRAALTGGPSEATIPTTTFLSSTTGVGGSEENPGDGYWLWLVRVGDQEIWLRLDLIEREPGLGIPLKRRYVPKPVKDPGTGPDKPASEAPPAPTPKKDGDLERTSDSPAAKPPASDGDEAEVLGEPAVLPPEDETAASPALALAAALLGLEHWHTPSRRRGQRPARSC